MNRLAFVLSRSTATHAMNLFFASAVSVLLLGFFGPRYGALLARGVGIAETMIVATGIILSVFLLVIRKKKPGFTWAAALVDYPAWCLRSVAERAACALFFLTVATFSMFSGAVVAVIPVAIVWRVL